MKRVIKTLEMLIVTPVVVLCIMLYLGVAIAIGLATVLYRVVADMWFSEEDSK